MCGGIYSPYPFMLCSLSENDLLFVFFFRYDKFLSMAESVVNMMRKGIAAKLTNHAVSMAAVERQCRARLVNARKNREHL